MRTNLTFPTTSGGISEYKGSLYYDYEKFHDEIVEVPLSKPFFTRRMKILSGTDGFMLYGKLGVDFFSTCEWLYPNMNIRLRLIRVKPNFYMITLDPIIVLELLIANLTLVVLL